MLSLENCIYAIGGLAAIPRPGVCHACHGSRLIIMEKTTFSTVIEADQDTCRTNNDSNLQNKQRYSFDR